MGHSDKNSPDHATHLLFAQAIAKPVNERSAFLDEACGDDSNLREHLEQMLADAIDEESDSTQSEKIGGYEVIRQIGQGGMGVVYLARDPQLDRQVALKLLQFGSMPHPDAVARFQQEMRAVARLSHPNIVTAYHASEHEGQQILVMEYVPGSDLAALIKTNGPASPNEAIGWVVQAARGLQDAHDAGIVHRDIKPANLLLDENGTIKILDLGLARIDTADPVGGGLTQSGMIMGSVDYIAPEQATATKDADQRADIYSLGCTLYFLLNGRPAFEGDSMFQKMQAHVEQPIPDLRDSQFERSEKLNSIFHRMLAKLPEDRYQTMGEVIQDLGDYLSEIEAPEGALPTRNSGRRILVAGAIGIAAICGAIWFFLSQSNELSAKTTNGNGLTLKPAASGGTGLLTDSGQRLGTGHSNEMKLGDLDGDGDLDAIVANYSNGADLVWLNDGKGNFISGMALGKGMETSQALGDLDGDGDLDAIVTDRNSTDQVWLNDGSGKFMAWGEGLSTRMTRNVTLGDLNGDGILDAVTSQGGTGTRVPNTIWFGDGDGRFRQSDQAMGLHATWETGLGDLDGDGDLDIVFANGDSKGVHPLEPNTVWLNDGQGQFEDTGQSLGKAFSRDVILDDLDGDGDLDAVFANFGSDSSGIWFNDGAGRFESTKQKIGVGKERSVILVDFDSDGDLDLVLAGDEVSGTRWFNDGKGNFSDPLSFGADGHYGVGDSGDLDGDGDWDLFLPRTDGEPNEVWLNESAPVTDPNS